MSENNNNEMRSSREFDPGQEQSINTEGQSSYQPDQYNYNDRGYTDSFYEDDYEESGAGSFLLGAVIGGVIGAAAALFLAPKTGKEMREDISTQAVHLKEKGIEISTVAKDKASEYSSVAKDKASEYTSVAKDKASEYTSVAKDKASEYTSAAKDKASEYTSVAKDKASDYKSAAKDKASEFTSVAKGKTEEVTKSIQEQSGQFVDKVKSMTSKTSVPMDDGTASLEGEEAIEFVEKTEDIIQEKLEEAEQLTTTTADAMKKAVVKAD